VGKKGRRGVRVSQRDGYAELRRRYTQPRSGGSWIRRRYRQTALLCAFLPCLLIAVLIGREYLIRGRLKAEPVTEAARRIQSDALVAQASALSSRLNSVSHGAVDIAEMAGLVLRSPQVFGAIHGQTAPVIASPSAGVASDLAVDAAQNPAGGEDAAGGSAHRPPQPAVGKAPLDKPMMYTRGKGGAIRKVFDDGGSSVFYRARGKGADFSVYERQRLFATGALDPLLRSATKTDPLCVQAFLLTRDGLLRTYPFRDFSSVEGDKDWTKLPLFAWTKEKAGPDGVVWTSPYASAVSGAWVIAGLARVESSGKLVAVAGVEVSLAALAKEGLAFSLGEQCTAWLQRADATVLAVPAGGEELLGVSALSGAPFPTETAPASKLLEKASLTLSGHEDLAWEVAELGVESPGSAILGEAERGRLVYTAPLGVAGCILGAEVSNPLIAEMHSYERKLRSATQRRALILLGVLGLSLLVAAGLAGIESVRITRPLQVMRMQVDNAVSGSRASLAITDDGEIGDLAAALQQLADSRVATGADAVPPSERGGLFDQEEGPDPEPDHGIDKEHEPGDDGSLLRV
jgi:hypothetical protein